MVKTKECPADDCDIAFITAVLLRRGRMLHHISLIISTLILARLALQSFNKGGDIEKTYLWIQALALLFGIAELWFAARVALDADLFEGIAEKKLDIVRLDKALMRFTRKIYSTKRDINDRSLGALYLLKLQGYCLLGQTAVFLTAILLV